MLTHRGPLVYLVPPRVGHLQLVQQLHAHASPRQIRQQGMPHLRSLKNIYYTPVDL